MWPFPIVELRRLKQTAFWSFLLLAGVVGVDWAIAAPEMLTLSPLRSPVGRVVTIGLGAFTGLLALFVPDQRNSHVSQP